MPAKIAASKIDSLHILAGKLADSLKDTSKIYNSHPAGYNIYAAPGDHAQRTKPEEKYRVSLNEGTLNITVRKGASRAFFDTTRNVHVDDEYNKNFLKLRPSIEELKELGQKHSVEITAQRMNRDGNYVDILTVKADNPLELQQFIQEKALPLLEKYRVIQSDNVIQARRKDRHQDIGPFMFSAIKEYPELVADYEQTAERLAALKNEIIGKEKVMIDYVRSHNPLSGEDKDISTQFKVRSMNAMLAELPTEELSPEIQGRLKTLKKALDQAAKDPTHSR